MGRAAQQARMLDAANEASRHVWPSDSELLAKRSFELGFAKGLLRNMLSAADAPEDIREQAINLAVAQIRRELGENGRLA